MNLAAVEIKAFVPSRDFEKSKQFYHALGFEIPWTSEDLAYVRYGETSFLLQSFYDPAKREQHPNASAGGERRRHAGLCSAVSLRHRWHGRLTLSC